MGEMKHHWLSEGSPCYRVIVQTLEIGDILLCLWLEQWLKKGSSMHWKISFSISELLQQMGIEQATIRWLFWLIFLSLWQNTTTDDTKERKELTQQFKNKAFHSGELRKLKWLVTSHLESRSREKWVDAMQLTFFLIVQSGHFPGIPLSVNMGLHADLI